MGRLSLVETVAGVEKNPPKATVSPYTPPAGTPKLSASSALEMTHPPWGAKFVKGDAPSNPVVNAAFAGSAKVTSDETMNAFFLKLIFK
jgi:hypothetical protein